MAITVYDNLVGGDRQTRTLDGREITKKIIVEGIPTSLYGDEKINYAIDNCGYVEGDLHGDYTNAKLVRFNARAIDTATVEIELIYAETNTDVTVAISTNRYQIDTNVDAEGNLLEVSYTYPADYELDETLRGKTLSKSPTLPKEMNEVVVTLTRTETITSGEIIVKALTYIDTLNLDGWTVSGAIAGTWKCEDISGTSNGDGTYDVTYVFAARKHIQLGSGEYVSGFSFDMFYRDERTGEPPADVVPYVELVAGVPDTAPGGIKQGQLIYPYANFNNIISI